MNNNHRGFTLVEMLLSLLLISFISFAGWYVWNANHGKATNRSGTATIKKENKVVTQADPTSGWVEYHDITGKFTLKYPGTWSKASNAEECESTFLLGPTAETVGSCRSDKTGQMIFYSFAVESGPLGLEPQYYTDIKTKSVEVDGVTGERQSGTFANAESGLGPANGSKDITYIFKTNGLIYKAFYAQEPGYPDVQKDFDLIVTKTFHFR